MGKNIPGHPFEYRIRRPHQGIYLAVRIYAHFLQWTDERLHVHAHPRPAIKNPQISVKFVHLADMPSMPKTLCTCSFAFSDWLRPAFVQTSIWTTGASPIKHPLAGASPCAAESLACGALVPPPHAFVEVSREGRLKKEKKTPANTCASIAVVPRRLAIHNGHRQNGRGEQGQPRIPAEPDPHDYA